MKIKNRLSLYFTLTSSVILLIAMAVIYVSFYKFLQIDFFNRLKDRINIVTRLYIDTDEQSRGDLSKTREKYLEKIPGEVIRIYNGGNDAAFIPEDKQYWPDDIINNVRKNGDIEYSDKGRHVVGVHFKDDQGDFVILASAPDSGRIKQLNQFMIIVALILTVSVILVFSIGRWFAENALFPIKRLVDQMQQINANNLDTRVKVGHANDEIGLLAKNFNQLLSQLEHSFELQKAFIANASHELRTPITSIIGEAEVSLNQTRTTKEYQSTIKSMLVESEKLNDTIAGLIDLAQVDINFSRAALVPIRVDDLIWEIQEYWGKKIYHNALQVRMDNVSFNESAMIIKANKALLTIALNNIIGNAFKFSENKSVNCSLETHNNKLIIKVKDYGIGISQEEKQKVFQPFYRSERSTGYTGNGIGLYVTLKIIQMLNGEIDIFSMPNSGTIVTIQFETIGN